MEKKAPHRQKVLDEMRQKEMKRLQTPSGLKEEQDRLLRADLHPSAAQQLRSIRKVQAWQDDLAKKIPNLN